MSPDRNAFGALLVDPERLDRLGRIDCLRRLSGRLQAAGDAESRWLGRALVAYLAGDGDLDQVLSVRPPQGDRRSVARLTRADHVRRSMCQLVVSVGSITRASRVLRGTEPLPAAVADLVHELRETKAPSSVRAFHRARATLDGR